MELNNKTIPIIDSEGNEKTVPAENLAGAIELGYKEITPQVRKEIEATKFAKESPFLAAGASTASGLTLGLSDLALTKSGLVAPETLKALREENPAISVAGEVVGAVAPAIFSGGTSIAAKALSKTPSALVERLGANVTSKVGSALAADQVAKGVTKNVIKEITKKGAALGAGGAAEGAIYGAGDLISENALGNADLSAENLIKSAGYGAALGGTLGFGIGASGAAIKKTIDEGIDLYDNTVVKNQIKNLDVDDEVKRGLLNKFEADENIDVIRKEVEKLKKTTSFLNDIEDPALVKTIENALPTDGILAEYADDALRSGTSPIATEYAERSTKAIEGIRKATQDIFEGKQTKTLGEIGDDIVGSINTRIVERTKPMSMAYNAIDELVAGVPVTKKDITRVIKNFSEGDIFKGALKTDQKAVTPYLQDFANVKSYSQAQKLKSSLTTKARELKAQGNFEQARIIKGLAGASDDLRKVLINKLPKEQSDILIPGLKNLDKEYAKANKDIGYLSEILGKKAGKGLTQAKAAIEEASSEFADSAKIANKLMNNRNIGFLKELQKQSPELFNLWKSLQLNRLYGKSFSGTSGLKEVNPKFLLNQIKKDRMMYGDVVDLVFTPKQVKKIESFAKAFDKLNINKNPSGTAKFLNFLDFLNSPVTSMVKDRVMLAIATGDVNLVKKEAGNSAAALSKIVDNDISQERKIIRSAKSFVKALETTSDVMRKGVIRGSVNVIPYTKEELEKSEEVYKDIQRDPIKLIESFQERNPELNQALPEVSNAASQVITRAVEFLQTKMPAKRTDYFMDEYNPSRSEIFKFAEYSEAVFDPDKVLERMKTGYVSPRQLEAMEVVYPETVAKMREYIVDALPKAKISEKGKNFISLVLGVQAKPSLEPQNIQSLQSTFAVVNAKENAGMIQPSAKKIKLGNNISKQVASDSDLALYRRNLS